MICVYFDNQPNNSDLKRIRQMLSEKSGIDYFASPEIPLNKLPSLSQHFQLDNAFQKKINFEILDYVVNFPDKLIGNKKVRDWYNIHGIDVWQYLKTRTYFRLRNLHYKKAIINKFSQGYTKVVFVTNDKFVEHLKTDHQKLEVIKLKNKNRFSIQTIFLYSIFLIINTLVFLSRKKPRKNHILIDKSEPDNYLDLTFKYKKGNHILGYLIENIPDDFLIIHERTLPKFDKNIHFKINIKGLFNDKNALPAEGIVLSGYLRKKIRAKVRKDWSQIKNQLYSAKNDMVNPLDKLTTSISIEFLTSVKVFLTKYYSFLRFFGDNNHYSTISAIDENSPITKCVFDAARESNIRTIGIQHGVIHQLHPAYIFSKNDGLKKVMPDYTMIWGDATRHVLTQQSHYPSESLITIGQIRTDIIPRMSKDSLKNLIPSYLYDKTVIMFASQPQRDPVLRYKAAEDVFNACKSIEHVHLVLKPHPIELNDLDYYRNIAKETGCTNYTIEKTLDLYSLLAISTIVITCFSTVGAEAVYFKKPLIIVDPLKQDLQKYHKNGVAFQITKSEELNNIIIKLLSNEISIDKAHYDAFIKNFAYKIDGKVSERYIKFIRSIGK